MEQQATTVSTRVTYLPLLNRRRLGEEWMKLQKNEKVEKMLFEAQELLFA